MCPRSPSAGRFRKRTTFLSLLSMCESWNISSSLRGSYQTQTVGRPKSGTYARTNR
jgi:hypothetical protein